VRTSRLMALGMAVVFVVGLAACGSSDDDEGVAGDSATEAAACQPVGEDLAASALKTVPVELKEYSFTPATVDVAAGVVTFAATNTGTLNHELAFLPGGGEVPLTTAGAPDEDALGTAGAFELDAFGPGLDCEATYDLEPGTYTLFCIVTDADGQTHLQKGMRGTLRVA
jgi:plastocyanin